MKKYNYKRLTYRDRFGAAGLIGEHDLSKEKLSDLKAHAIHNLADFEDKLDQEQLIQLPCRVGETVYVVDPDKEEIEQMKLCGASDERSIGGKFVYFLISKNGESCDTAEIENIFLTQSQAKEWLEELRMKREFVKDIEVLKASLGCLAYDVIHNIDPEEGDEEQINKIVLKCVEMGSDGQFWYRGTVIENNLNTLGHLINLCATLEQAQERLKYLIENNENT